MTKKLRNIFAAAAAALSLNACAGPVPEGRPGHDLRHLTRGEIAMARAIFGNQIDYSKVTILATQGNRSMVVSGVIRMANGDYSADYSRDNNSDRRGVFIHEMTHIWQHHQGVDVTGEAISLFFEHGGNYQRSYDYNLSAVRSFAALGIEQQASIVQDFFVLTESVNGRNKRALCPKIRDYEAVLEPVLPAARVPRICR